MFLGFVKDYSNDELLASSKTVWISERFQDLILNHNDFYKCMKMVFEFEKSSQLSEITIDSYQKPIDCQTFQMVTLTCGSAFGFVWHKNERVGHRTQYHQLFS
jgi:hypothetical protein